MKQAFSLLLALTMLTALAACGGSPAPTPAADSAGEADSTGAEDEADAAPEPTSAPMAQADVTMETQVLADYLGVKLTVSDWTYEPFETPEGDPNGSYSYTLTVENSSGKPLTLCRIEGEGAAKNVSILVPTMVNGHGFDSFLSPKNETMNGDMSNWLDSYTIPDGESRSFLAYISEQLCPLDEHDPWLPVQVRQFYTLYEGVDANADDPGGELHLTVDAEIVTSARRAYEVELADAGAVVYKDDITTVYADRFYYEDSPDAVENAYDYYSLNLYVHNSGDTVCTARLEDVSLNGMESGAYTSAVHAYWGGTTLLEVPFLPQQLSDMGITSLDDVESFHCVVTVTDGENVLARTPVDLDSAWFESHSSSYTTEHPEA